MNQYIFLRRMRGPILLLTFGITAILDEYAGIGYSHSWPLYLIVWGLLKLAENAILAQHPPVAPAGYSATPGSVVPPPPVSSPDSTASGTSIVPFDATSHDDEERR